jgi:O-antigen/teichoic acid export membrane protein
MSLGFFYTGARLIALDKNGEYQKGYFFILFSFAGIASAVGIGLVFVVAPIQELLLNNDLGFYLQVSSPLIACFIFQACLNNLLQGAGKIYELSLFKILPSVLYLILIWGFMSIFEYTLTHLLVFQAVSFIFPILFFLYFCGGDKKTGFEVIENLKTQNSTHGFHVYLGSIVGVGSTYLASLIVAYYLDIKYVGFYGLAVTLCAPLQMIPSVIGTTFFKEFATYISIPRKVLVSTFLLSLVALIGFIVVIGWAVDLLYGDEYKEVIGLTRLMVFGYFFYGLGDFFNRFVSAKGKGRALKKVSITVGVINIVGFCILINLFGVIGGGVTIVISGCVYCLLLMFYYRQAVSVALLNKVETL